MRRRTTVILWCASVAYFVLTVLIASITVTFFPERHAHSPQNELLSMLLASPIVITIWTSFSIFYSLLVWMMLAAGSKPVMEKHGGVLHFLLWKELQDELRGRQGN
jgi:hypothetical protein